MIFKTGQLQLKIRRYRRIYPRAAAANGQSPEPTDDYRLKPVGWHILVARTLVSAAPRLVSALLRHEEGRDESRPGRHECLRHFRAAIPAASCSPERRRALDPE